MYQVTYTVKGINHELNCSVNAISEEDAIIQFKNLKKVYDGIKAVQRY